MYLVNSFNCVVVVDDEEYAKKKIASGEMRLASNQEIAAKIAERNSMRPDHNSIYYQTVRSTPDGYGMSRDHIKSNLAKIDVKLSETFADQKIGFLYNQPYSVPSMRNDVRIVYTMFESTKLPADWVDYLEAADEVLVPSKWCQEVFAKAGIQSTVVPLGYNNDVFKYYERPAPADTPRPFTFIHYDSFNLRKGFMEVLEAFRQEFKKTEDVKLILKTVREHTSIPVVKSQYPNIQVERGAIGEHDLFNLLKTADCMVYPSRGEGFGCTPLEAMATGLPAIVPNEHGISEYFNSKYMLEVKATGRCPGLYSKFRGTDVGQMVICDVDDLRKQMRYAFEHQDEMRELGKSASEYVKTYTYRQTADRLSDIFDKWSEAKVVRRPDAKYLRVTEI